MAITQANLFQAPTAVPEPSSLACVSGLVAGLSVLSRRRRQA
ncbi:MAG: PEP-CTERM sorting domain-containing protein [Planctomycetota bacterium]